MSNQTDRKKQLQIFLKNNIILVPSHLGNLQVYRTYLTSYIPKFSESVSGSASDIFEWADLCRYSEPCHARNRENRLSRGNRLNLINYGMILWVKAWGGKNNKIHFTTSTLHIIKAIQLQEWSGSLLSAHRGGCQQQLATEISILTKPSHHSHKKVGAWEPGSKLLFGPNQES